MLMTGKIGRVVTYDGKLALIKSHKLLSRCLMRSRDKLKTFYLKYHNAHSHQIWKGGDLP